MKANLTTEQETALRNAIRELEVHDHGYYADDLRRRFEFDLANLKYPTEEEKKCIAYASMH